MRILVKEVNWLGDLVISLPALDVLRRARPTAHLAVLVRQNLAPFFDGLDWVNEVLPYSISRGVRGIGDRFRLIADLRRRGYDLAVVFPKSFESALWPALAGVPERAGWRTDGRGLLLTHATAFAPLPGHQAESYLSMIRATLGFETTLSDPPFAAAPHHREAARAWLAPRRRRPDAPLVALAVAAAYGPAKEWPAASYAALIDALADRHGAECVLVGAPEERGRCHAVASASRAGALVAAAELPLGETIGLLSSCQAFAGNDSGAMHVAAVLGVPTVGLFGSTDPVRTAPLGPHARVLHHPIECSPCFARTCRFGHYECLRRIDVEDVRRAVADLAGFSE